MRSDAKDCLCTAQLKWTFYLWIRSLFVCVRECRCRCLRKNAIDGGQNVPEGNTQIVFHRFLPFVLFHLSRRALPLRLPHSASAFHSTSINSNEFTERPKRRYISFNLEVKLFRRTSARPLARTRKRKKKLGRRIICSVRSMTPPTQGACWLFAGRPFHRPSASAQL